MAGHLGNLGADEGPIANQMLPAKELATMGASDHGPLVVFV